MRDRSVGLNEHCLFYPWRDEVGVDGMTSWGLQSCSAFQNYPITEVYKSYCLSEADFSFEYETLCGHSWFEILLTWKSCISRYGWCCRNKIKKFAIKNKVPPQYELLRTRYWFPRARKFSPLLVEHCEGNWKSCLRRCRLIYFIRGSNWCSSSIMNWAFVPRPLLWVYLRRRQL